MTLNLHAPADPRDDPSAQMEYWRSRTQDYAEKIHALEANNRRWRELLNRHKTNVRISFVLGMSIGFFLSYVVMA